MPETKIDIDRLTWLATMALNNANVAARGVVPLDETRAAVLLAAKIMHTAFEDLTQVAVALQGKAHAASARCRGPLDLKPGEWN